MYSTRPNLLLGFHGCEREEQAKLLDKPDYFRKSNNKYDWLGHGMYFWENNQARAMDWAKMKKKTGSIDEPAVIGAVIDLGLCLDLFDSDNIQLLKEHFHVFKNFGFIWTHRMTMTFLIMLLCDRATVMVISTA